MRRPWIWLVAAYLCILVADFFIRFKLQTTIAAKCLTADGQRGGKGKIRSEPAPGLFRIADYFPLAIEDIFDPGKGGSALTAPEVTTQ